MIGDNGSPGDFVAAAVRIVAQGAVIRAPRSSSVKAAAQRVLLLAAALALSGVRIGAHDVDRLDR